MEDLNTLPGASLLVSIEAIQHVRGTIAGFFKEADRAREQASDSHISGSSTEWQERTYNSLALALSYEAQGGAMRHVLHFLFTKEVLDSLPEVEPLNPLNGSTYTRLGISEVLGND